MKIAGITGFLGRREGILLVGGILLACLAGLVFWLTRPSTLIVAVGPRDAPDTRLMRAYAAALARAQEDVRLKLLPFEDVRDSAAALQSNRVDLAVVRPDAQMPDNGLTLAILRTVALLVVAPGSSGIAALPDLAHHRLGVVAQHEADLPLVRHVLDFYALGTKDEAGAAQDAAVALVPLKADEVANALATHRIDAVAIVATPTGPAAGALVRTVAAADPEGKIAFLSVPNGTALTERRPEFQTLELAPGTFGGRPERPDKEVETIGTSYRLVAREGLSRDVASAVTQHLFEYRSRLAAAAPSAKLLAKPDFDDAVGATSARLPNHPGAVDYYQREQQTFFQRYEDLIYLVAFLGGGLGSAGAWISQRLARKRRVAIEGALDRFDAILPEVRAVCDIGQLDALAQEVDALVMSLVGHARHGTIDTRTMAALLLAVDALRAGIADRRAALTGTAPAAPASVLRHLSLNAAAE